MKNAKECRSYGRRRVASFLAVLSLLLFFMASDIISKKIVAQTQHNDAEGETLIMQSEINRNLITEMYERLNRGDTSMFVDHLADDAIFVMQGRSSWSGTRRGKENILRFFRDIVAQRAPGERRTVPVQVIADSDIVVMEAIGEMTSREGVPYRNYYCIVFRLQDEMIMEMKEYLDTAYLESVLGPLEYDPTRD